MRNTYLWFFQLLTGALLGIALGLHMVMMHLGAILGFFGVDVGVPVSWSSMMERASQGLWVAFYIAFLAMVLYHGLNGLRGIILELAPSAKTETIVTRIIIAFGVIAFILGTYVPLTLFLG